MSNKMKGIIITGVGIAVGVTGVAVIKNVIKNRKEKTNKKSKKNKKK